MTASIVGWAHTPFGKFDTQTVEGLVVKVATDALADAGISAGDVDEIVLGHFNAAASRRRILPRRWCCRPIRRCAGTRPPGSRMPAPPARPRCIKASGRSRRGRRRPCWWSGSRPMTRTPPAEIGRNLLRASYLPEDGDTPGGFAGVCSARSRNIYFQKYGDQSDALAMIAAKNHKNGVANPLCADVKDFGYEFCRAESEKNPFVAGPLKRTDCSLVSDGAAALVLMDAETAKTIAARRSTSAPPRMPRISCRCRSAISCNSKVAPWRGSARAAIGGRGALGSVLCRNP